MPMDGDRLGAAIAATIQSFKPAADEKISGAILVQMWQAVAADIVDEINTNADISLLAADVPVPALGILDGTTSPCSGAALSGPTGPMTGRIS